MGLVSVSKWITVIAHRRLVQPRGLSATSVELVSKTSLPLPTSTSIRSRAAVPRRVYPSSPLGLRHLNTTNSATLSTEPSSSQSGFQQPSAPAASSRPHSSSAEIVPASVLKEEADSLFHHLALLEALGEERRAQESCRCRAYPTLETTRSSPSRAVACRHLPLPERIGLR